MAAFILITLFVKHELSYDRYHKEANSIYRIVRNEYTCSPPPMGQMVLDSRNNEFSVAEVFKDFPGNSHFRFDLVFPFERYFQITENDPKSWGSNYTYSYVKTNPQADMASVNEKLMNLEKGLVRWTEESGLIETLLTKL